MTTLSNVRTTIDGDINVGRGQLGYGWSGTTSSSLLWSLQQGANHYAITPSVLGTIITLPQVGTGSTQAQPGHWLTIANTSTTLNLTVNNSSGTTIGILTPGNSLKIIADSIAASSWVVQYNTSGYGVSTTLQGAYNASGTTNPQITLTNAFGSLKLADAATPLTSLFEIHNNAGLYHYLRVGNSTSGSQTPYIGLLGSTVTSSQSDNLAAIGSTITGAATSIALIGSNVTSTAATGNNIAAIGSTVSNPAINSAALINSTVSGNRSVGISGATISGNDSIGFRSTVSGNSSVAFGTVTINQNGCVALCDSQSAYTGYTSPQTFYATFTGGEQRYGGATNIGTSKTSPNEITFYVTRNNVTTAGTSFNLIGTTASPIITALASTTYSITLEIYGRDVTTSSTVSARHTVDALSVTSSLNVPTLISQMVNTSESAGFGAIPASATLSTTATDLVLTLVAPDNVAAPASAMDYRIFGKFRALTE